MGDTPDIGTVSKSDLVERATAIIDEMYPDKMTLRQVYYQLVARLVIENKVSAYKRLSAVLVEAREDGYIPWDAMEDRTRSILGQMSLNDQDDYVEMVDGIIDYLETARGVNADRWRFQKWYVEVWLEKQALEGVFEDVTDDFQVVLMPGRGYSSATFLKEAAERLETAKDEGKKVAVLYFGDYDPSGMDIERYVEEKIEGEHGIHIDHFARVALTLDQIRQYNLPPVPAKKTDSRRDAFVAVHGDMAVELDALNVRVLKDLIRDAIQEFWDDEAWNRRNDDLRVARARFRTTLVEKVEELVDKWRGDFIEDDDDEDEGGLDAL